MTLTCLPAYSCFMRWMTLLVITMLKMGLKSKICRPANSKHAQKLLLLLVSLKGKLLPYAAHYHSVQAFQHKQQVMPRPTDHDDVLCRHLWAFSAQAPCIETLACQASVNDTTDHCTVLHVTFLDLAQTAATDPAVFYNRNYSIKGTPLFCQPTISCVVALLSRWADNPNTVRYCDINGDTTKLQLQAQSW